MPSTASLLRARHSVAITQLATRSRVGVRAREQAWDDCFDRENPRPLDEAIGNEASLARMTAIAAVETVCFHVARAAGEVDNLGLPAAATPRKGD